MRIAAVVGPTASGKSELAMGIVRRFGGEIVSVDSMQIYRGMDIGTAKPSASDLAEVPHHLISFVDPGDDFSVGEFQKAGRAVLTSLARRERPVVICGGSGLHFRALVDRLEFPPTDVVVRADLKELVHQDLVDELLRSDSEAVDHVDLANPRRVLRAVEILRLTGEGPSTRAEASAAVAVRNYQPRIGFEGIGIEPGDGLPARIDARLDAMLGAGWLEEVEALGSSLGPTARLAVGYRELAAVSRGEADLAFAREEILRATVALARRQRTFFRRDPRIRWIPWHDDAVRRVDNAVALLEEAEWSS